MARVVVHQAQSDLVERRLDGGDLGQDIDAIAVFVDHVLHAPDLPFISEPAVKAAVEEAGCELATPARS